MNRNHLIPIKRRIWELLMGGTLVVAVVLAQGCNPIRALGKNPSGEALKRIEALPNYQDGAFQNLEQIAQNVQTVRSATTSVRRGPRWLRMLKYVTSQPKELLPPKPLVAVKTDLVNTTYNKPTVIWFGHSSFLLKTGAMNILFDPSFSGFAGPVKGAIRAFKGSHVYDHTDMPVIDALVISHDHYDHLDYLTVKRLRKKVKRVIVPIGVGSHFRRWGFPDDMITELNWNESVTLAEAITITATPAHHRSNRTFKQVRKTLWASYVINADGHTLFFSGDSGYSRHFKLIGEQYGPFDLALLECGQYNEKWPQSHMFPVQTAQAALDLRAAMTIPIHWAKYAESEHAWNEPVNLYRKAADSLHVPVTVPRIGEPYTIGTAAIRTDWWNAF
ncbi:MBL fold metallo-hydrolase [Nibrella viscosa]